MVINHVKVFARLKPHDSHGKSKEVKYSIQKQDNKESLLIYSKPLNSSNRTRWYNFRFRKVFDQNTKQAEIFENVAKPIIHSYLNGYNGTIFAYGQTGSGKTYTITGSPDSYDERGLIPRSIEHIFRFTSKNLDKCGVAISYIEIYNEAGYDLLDPKHQASFVEHLPKVTLLEDGKGNAHVRNLSIHHVSNEDEAMRLLFLGDINRTIAETPMNEISSRSHCIFTIYLSCWIGKTGKIRRSKLHLVDLAGSERIYKSNMSGSTLMEAKSINLSLHYLEQVILALSESNRTHVPYRNSMMTYLLRDSLGGNCFTVMLATITMKSLEETISTCKFSQRVAMISTDVYINEDFDPYEEIYRLRKEIQHLKDQLKLKQSDDAPDSLTDEEIEKCNYIVKKYLAKPELSTLSIQPDMRLIQYCFYLMKGKIKDKDKDLRHINNQQLMSKYKEIIKQKEEEISMLNFLIKNAYDYSERDASDKETNTLSNQNGKPKDTKDQSVQNTEKKILHIFRIHSDLDKKYKIATNLVPLIEQCQNNIVMIRKKLQAKVGFETSNKLIEELKEQQNIYRQSLLELQNIKTQVSHMEHGLKRAEIIMGAKLKRWITESLQDNLLRRSLSLNSATEEEVLNRAAKKYLKECTQIPYANTSDIFDPIEKGIQPEIEDIIKKYKREESEERKTPALKQIQIWLPNGKEEMEDNTPSTKTEKLPDKEHSTDDRNYSGDVRRSSSKENQLSLVNQKSSDETLKNSIRLAEYTSEKWNSSREEEKEVFKDCDYIQSNGDVLRCKHKNMHSRNLIQEDFTGASELDESKNGSEDRDRSRDSRRSSSKENHRSLVDRKSADEMPKHSIRHAEYTPEKWNLSREEKKEFLKLRDYIQNNREVFRCKSRIDFEGRDRNTQNKNLIQEDPTGASELDETENWSEDRDNSRDLRRNNSKENHLSLVERKPLDDMPKYLIKHAEYTSGKWNSSKEEEEEFFKLRDYIQNNKEVFRCKAGMDFEGRDRKLSLVERKSTDEMQKYLIRHAECTSEKWNSSSEEEKKEFLKFCDYIQNNGKVFRCKAGMDFKGKSKLDESADMLLRLQNSKNASNNIPCLCVDCYDENVQNAFNEDQERFQTTYRTSYISPFVEEVIMSSDSIKPFENGRSKCRCFAKTTLRHKIKIPDKLENQTSVTHGSRNIEIVPLSLHFETDLMCPPSPSENPTKQTKSVLDKFIHTSMQSSTVPSMKEPDLPYPPIEADVHAGSSNTVISCSSEDLKTINSETENDTFSYNTAVNWEDNSLAANLIPDPLNQDNKKEERLPYKCACSCNNTTKNVSLLDNDMHTDLLRLIDRIEELEGTKEIVQICKCLSSDTTCYESQNKREINDLFKESDSPDFLEFMKTIPLTGDKEVDEEIVNFYRAKFT